MTPAITNPSKAMQKILLALALLLTTHTAIAETRNLTSEAEKRLACGDYQPLANAPRPEEDEWILIGTIPSPAEYLSRLNELYMSGTLQAPQNWQRTAMETARVFSNYLEEKSEDIKRDGKPYRHIHYLAHNCTRFTIRGTIGYRFADVHIYYPATGANIRQFEITIDHRKSEAPEWLNLPQLHKNLGKNPAYILEACATAADCPPISAQQTAWLQTNCPADQYDNHAMRIRHKTNPARQLNLYLCSQRLSAEESRYHQDEMPLRLAYISGTYPETP